MRQSYRGLANYAAWRLKLAASLTIVLGGQVLRAEAPRVSLEEATFFESKVRPILFESCTKCHGEKKQSSGLRLDSREAILEGGVNGAAALPGNAEASLLIQVVRRTHDDIKMPPKEKLPTPAIDALVIWVKMGLPWPKETLKPAVTKPTTGEHWAFGPVRTTALPNVNDQAWVHTQVDAFILDRLEKASLTPSPEADKPTLIRRITFDLTGLPPTPAEIDAFIMDESREAYEKLVDRILASPHYGERWGRHWLDVARYADTKGYVFTQERKYPYSYTYRDYVIRSFNEDKPYNVFLTEQIAADRLGPGHDPMSLAALGFLTVGRRFLNNQEDIIDDRIDVVSRGLLGLTVTCARCHDHKFDPIPTDDYYSLYGVFASSVEPEDPPEIPAAVPKALSLDFQKKLAEAQKGVDAFLDARLEAVRSEIHEHIASYLKAAFDLGFDPKNNKLDERARADKLTPSRLRGMIVRTKAKLDASRTQPDPIFAPWHAFSALSASEFSRKAPSTAHSLAATNDPKALNPVVAKAFADQPPFSMMDVAARYGKLLTEAQRRWKESEKGGAKALSEPGWEALRLLLYGKDGPFNVDAESLPRLLDRAERNKLNALTNKVAALRATHPGSPPRAMVLKDAPHPVEPHVFLRGNSGRPGKQVPRQFLAVLSRDRKPFKDGSGRLELAKAIADKNNPLTARVFVNRVWLQHFGTGLVSSPSDFGMRSDPPTHPELLDWLADDFMRHGWSIKQLQKRIVLSSTYRQQSVVRREALEVDPENRLYWKFNRHRLEFEAIRDSLLAASGVLDESIGGRPVSITEAPYPPRRTVYGFIDRQNLEGVYRTFDFASPDASSPRRFVTTVPQQALFLMNDPFVIAQAKRVAALPELNVGSSERRVQRLYQRLFGRQPSPAEFALGRSFIDQQADSGPSLPISGWAYGYGGYDEAKQLVKFQAFPHWTGTAWQFGPTLPHALGSYLHLSAGGGHVGADIDHSSILRWIAPGDTKVSVEGALAHEGNQGDGVRGRIISSRRGVLGTWVAANGKVNTKIEKIELKTGEAVDFLVDCRGDQNYDSFTWNPILRATEPNGATGIHEAKSEFHGPEPIGLTPWQEYAQVLLLTNEFAFVD